MTSTFRIYVLKRGLASLFQISLYRNAFYLITANVINALFGIAFWIVVARFYIAEDVGLASAAISAAMLLGSISHLGMGFGLVRFLSRSDKNAIHMINSCLTIGILSSFVVVAIFIGGTNFWSPSLIFLRHNPIYFVSFITFTIIITTIGLSGQAFIAQRRTGFILSRNLISGILRLILPICLATFFHSFGIFAAWGIATGVTLLVSLFLFLPMIQQGYHVALTIKKELVKEIMQFSFANYISNLLWVAPGYVLPIMVVNLLGAEPNAYFYVVWSVGNILFTVSTFTATSLFAEGSFDEAKLGVNTRRSLKLVFLLLTPVVILILVFGDKILLVFGKDYAENATTLLRILAVSSIPLSINVIYFSIKRIEIKLKVIINLTAFTAVDTLGLTYWLLPRMGINGVGVAWLISQGVVALGIIFNSIWNRRK